MRSTCDLCFVFFVFICSRMDILWLPDIDTFMWIKVCICSRDMKHVLYRSEAPGGYPSTHDITVFRRNDRDQNSFHFQLEEGDKCVPDSGYAGELEKIVMTQDEHPKDFKEFLTRCKNRQETFHCLKAFNILPWWSLPSRK